MQVIVPAPAVLLAVAERATIRTVIEVVEVAVMSAAVMGPAVTPVTVHPATL